MTARTTNFHRIIRLSAYALACFIAIGLLGRVSVLLAFAPGDSVAMESWFGLAIYSLRWDAKLWATIAILPALVVALAWPHRFLMRLSLPVIRLWFVLLSMVYAAFYFAQWYYWQVYGNSFDFNVLGVVNDDTSEVLKLLWQEYNIPLILVALLALTSLFWWLFVRFERQQKAHENGHWLSNLFKHLGFLVLCLVLARGSFSTFPLSEKTTNFTNAAWLQELAIPAVAHFNYALSDNRKDPFNYSLQTALSSHGFDSLEQAIEAAQLSGLADEYGIPWVQSSLAEKSYNVVFVSMEGWSTHILRDPQVQGELAPYMAQAKVFDYSLSSRQGTNRFIESLLLATPVFNVSISSAQSTPLSNSYVRAIEGAGVEATFISTGSRNWFNHGNFWTAQGFNDHHDMNALMATTGARMYSDWGVHDEYLYEYTETFLEGKSSPQFVFLKTTTNHPPHEVPYEAQDYTLSHYSDLIDPKDANTQLATFHYANNQLGRFLEALTRSGALENTLVVATGDHTLWRFSQYSQVPAKLHSAAVPIMMWGPDELLDQLSEVNQPVDHSVLMPTIIDLAVPGVQYLSPAHSLLRQSSQVAWHERGVWLFDDFAWLEATQAAYKVDDSLLLEPMTGRQLSGEQLALMRQRQAREALVQWRMLKDINKHKIKQ